MTITQLIESKEYKIAEVVFSKTEFKAEDIRNALHEEGIDMTHDELIDILENFRDSGLIAKVGRAYALNL